MNSPIVITGMGIVSPLGCGVEGVWRRLIESQSGIGVIDRFDTTDFPIQIAGLVPTIEQDPDLGLDSDNLIDRKERKKIDTFTLYAIAAAQEALEQAGWFPKNDRDQQATATII
ncbi:MAG TPA: beta-ketoacyl-ACP synthase, partial [Gammaproteobacteria bacterium]|nr:beta-ketoacyl-ACP synthase [Gammaproteobacteria bacterium]